MATEIGKQGVSSHNSCLVTNDTGPTGRGVITSSLEWKEVLLLVNGIPQVELPKSTCETLTCEPCGRNLES